VTLGLSQHNSAQLISADRSWGVHGHTMACWGIEGSNFPFGLGFLLATFFFVFGTLFGHKKVALLNPSRVAKPMGKLQIEGPTMDHNGSQWLTCSTMHCG